MDNKDVMVGMSIAITDDLPSKDMIGTVKDWQLCGPTNFIYEVVLMNGQTLNLRSHQFKEFVTPTYEEYMQSINGKIVNLDNEAVRDKYFVKWLHSLAKNDLSDPTINENYFNSIAHNPNVGQHTYGYKVNNKTEGIIQVVELSNNRCNIYWFFVNKQKHNLGIGQKLFNHVMEKYHNRILELTTRATSDRAIHIYKKYGFQIINSFTQTIQGTNVDLYRMRREPSLVENVGVFFMDDLFTESIHVLLDYKSYEML